MRHRLVLLAALLGFALARPSPALAQETQPGDACAAGDIHRARQVAGPENPGAGYLLVCDGSTWKIVDQWDTGTGNSLFQVDYDTGACDALKEGRLRYSSTGDLWEYCHSNAWTELAGGGSDSGNGAIIDAIAAFTTVDPVTITATNDKWPDYIVCNYTDGLPLVMRLSWYLAGASKVGYNDGDSDIYEFNADGTYASRTGAASNCGATAGDINSICNDGRCGFFGDGSSVATPAGANRQIQFNSIGKFAADSSFTFTSAGRLLITAKTGASNVFVTGGNETTAGFQNVGVGAGALAGLAATCSGNDCSKNTAIGYNAGNAITTGFNNTLIGRETGDSITTANANTFVGEMAGGSTTTGHSNVFIGQGSGADNIDGFWNIIVGEDAGNTITSGDRNTILGSEAGKNNLTTGSDNILIGYNAAAPAASSDNRLNIGNTIYGDLSTDHIGIGTASPQAALDVAGGVKVANDAATCVSTKNGTIRYVSGGSPPWEYCDGSAWLPFESAAAAGGGIGSSCGGGVFAGQMSISSTVYDIITTSAADENTGIAWGPTGVTTGATGPDGAANTATLVGLAGSYPAAEYCDSLTAGGQTDWYLPSEPELSLVIANRFFVGDISTSGEYTSSSEEGSNDRRIVWYDTNGLINSGGDTKSATSYLVRCIRREPEGTCPDGDGCEEGGLNYAGNCWYTGQSNQSCTTVCASRGGYNPATMTYSGSSGTDENCAALTLAFSGSMSVFDGATDCGGLGGGCFYDEGTTTTWRCSSPATTEGAAASGYRRFCACSQ